MDLPKEHEDALRLQMEDVNREPTPQEVAVYKLALNDAEERNDVATLILGVHPGWFYRQPFDFGCPFASFPGDVYLYSPGYEKRFIVTSVEQAMCDFDVGGYLLLKVTDAFRHGALKIEVRPMKELEEAGV